MCCGSILGLLLAHTFVGDSTQLCGTIHIVKRNSSSKHTVSVVMIEDTENSLQNYSKDEQKVGGVEDVGLYDTESGWMKEGMDGEEEEVEGVSGVAGGKWVCVCAK